MTSYTDKGKRPEKGVYHGFDHLHFWVGNAYQAAAYYVCRFGFEPYAFRGLETGSREVMTQVVRQNDVIFAFSSPLEPNNASMTTHTAAHGDGVKEVAFRVTDCKAIYNQAVMNGAVSVCEPEVVDSGDGVCVIAKIEAPGNHTWHTFVERDAYKGVFLPGFASVTDKDPQVDLVATTDLKRIDHVVYNFPEAQLETTVKWYQDKLGFHRFWSVDDTQLHTEFSSLRSVVVSDYDERVKMPINEPARGLRKSQIQEFVEYYGGPGVQHIAMRTNDITSSVSRLKERGVSFIKVPDSYYDKLIARLSGSAISVKEDLSTLQSLGILVDFDEDGYLLQIFTKPVQDRPTTFMEIIQRYRFEGFGAGNFKSLFEAIEGEQALRGNL